MKVSLSLLATAALALAAPTPNKKRAGKMQFFGVNESGPEFGEGTLPGAYGKEYIWPTPSTIDTFIANGMNTFRINTLMERMVPNKMTGAFDAGYMKNLTASVNYITNKGAYAMIVPHNYGRYYGQVFTSASDFKTFWQNVAAQYKGNSRVIFDTNNEFHDEAGQNVANMNQAAVDGIRAAGATSQYIMVEGNAWTGAWTWTTVTGTDGNTNAQTMGALKDPQNKIIYQVRHLPLEHSAGWCEWTDFCEQMHQYLDVDGSGTHDACVSATIGSERLQAATTWLRQNKKKGLIGEFAGAVNPTCQAAVQDMLAFINKNNDVVSCYLSHVSDVPVMTARLMTVLVQWTGALWWAAGPWWGNYMFSIEPTSGPAYSTYLPIIKQYA